MEYCWWLIIPRKYFRIKDGVKVYEPENDVSFTPDEPGRLDDLVAIARVPLSATYGDDQHRDPRGLPESVSCWAQVPIPADRLPTTLEDVAGRTRRDMLVMRLGGNSGMFGVAADAKNHRDTLRPLSYLEPDKISDAAFAEAVRRGFDDLRASDNLTAFDNDQQPPAQNRPPR